MPNLVIKLKRLSVEEIEVATGRQSIKDNSENGKQKRKQKKSSRIANNEKNKNSNKENDEAGTDCRKKIKINKMTKNAKNLDQTEKQNGGISNQNVTEKKHIAIDERVEIREKIVKKNKSKLNMGTIENNSVTTNDDNNLSTSKSNNSKK